MIDAKNINVKFGKRQILKNFFTQNALYPNIIYKKKF